MSAHEQWGGLPLDDRYYMDVPNRCTGCGGACPENYEHCDDCLMRAVRGANAVTRAVLHYRDRKYRYRRLAP